MKLSQRVEDWLILLGLVAIGILVNVVLGTALLYTFELLGLWPIGEAAADHTLRAIRGASARSPIGVASAGCASISAAQLDDCITTA